MLRFRGQYTHSMDKKGRVSIPVRFRETLRSRYDEQLILSVGYGCLVAYPVKEWEELEDSIKQFSRFNTVVADYKRMFLSPAQDCPLDSQGRILVPPELRVHASLQDKVFFVGMTDHFEIWNRDRFQERYEPMQDRGSEIAEAFSRLTQQKKQE